MGLGDPDLIEDSGGGGLVAGPVAAVSCSICLEFVIDSGDRSTARLQCGHQFHLDCIGSAFNAKGAMQCPNCRKTEKGNWLYSNGYRSFPEFMDEWMHDDDFYDITYSEVPFGVHFCPFSRLARFPFSYEEGEYTSSIGHNDLLGHHAVFAEYPGTSLYPHLCPYIGGHVHPPPLSSSGSQVSNEGAAIDGSNFHHPWSNMQGLVDVSNSNAIPALDHHQTWDSHTQPNNHVTGVEQASASTTTRAVRLGSDAHPRQMYVPLIVGQGSGSRVNNSSTSMVPHYAGNSRAHGRHEGHSAYPRVRGVASFFPEARRFVSSRGLAPVGPTPPAAEQPNVYFFPPVAPSTRNPQDSETSGGSNLYAWERDQLAPFPLLPVDRDFPWWGHLPQTNASRDSSSRTGFWPWPGSDRPSLQHPPHHHPRLHPFI